MNNWLEITIKTILLFFSTLILTRIMGKTNLSKMTPFYFVNYIVIAIVVSLISLNVVTNVAFGITVLGIWVFFLVVLQYLSIKSDWLHKIINGKEKVLIKNGKIMEENLSLARLKGEELLKELRSKNVFNLADVEFAVMETTGEINVTLKSEKKPLTAYDLGKKVAPKAEAQVVIIDGVILHEGLIDRGLNQDWLMAQLENADVTVENVFIGQIDSSGDLYLDLFDDKIQVPQPKVKELLYANLQKAQADLMSFALESDNKEAKDMYLRNAEKLKKSIEKIEAYLLR